MMMFTSELMNKVAMLAAIPQEISQMLAKSWVRLDHSSMVGIEFHSYGKRHFFWKWICLPFM